MDGEARTHDAAGNTTSIGSKTFTYSDANRMNAVKQGDAVLESYGYNHRGERVLRTPAGGAAQITLYDEAGQWLGNYSATGQAQQQAIWLDNYPVALINVPGTGVPELAYVQPDHLGTPRVVIDPVSDVAIWEWNNRSEVFGNQIPSADPDGDGVAFELALRFPGQQATDSSGLFYNYQREYDPAVGRYSQSDPIGLRGGASIYAYTGNDPLDFVDPLGLLRYHSWVSKKYPATTEFLNGTKDRMTSRKYDGFQRYGNIGQGHLDQLLSKCDGPVITPKYMRHDDGSYAPGSGEIFIHETYFDRFESGDRSPELLQKLERTLEHELVHFSEYFWNKNQYKGEEGWSYEEYVYGIRRPASH